MIDKMESLRLKIQSYILNKKEVIDNGNTLIKILMFLYLFILSMFFLVYSVIFMIILFFDLILHKIWGLTNGI